MERRIPLVAEQLEIDRKTVETGRVRIHKSTRDHVERIDVPVLREEVDIRRVAVNRPVDAPVPVRQDGDVTIVSLHEEVPVLVRQLVVTEELHIRRRTKQVHAPQEVVLRRESIEIARRPAPPGARPQDAPPATPG